MAFADHPHTDPGDGRTECQTCGKWVFESIHSCKGVPVTAAARLRAPWAWTDPEVCSHVNQGWSRRMRDGAAFDAYERVRACVDCGREIDL